MTTTMPAVQTATFRAMGCQITLTAVDRPEAVFALEAQELAELVELWEQRFSRFRPESALSRLNAAAGQGPQQVDAPLFEMIGRAVTTARSSSGWFNPLILTALTQCGYDRTFPDVEARGGWVRGPGTPVPGVEQIVLDPVASTVALPAGAQIDLGGIAKGAFVEAAFARVATAWPGGCLNVGGDLRLWGIPPSGNYWRVGIEDPRHFGRDLAIAEILDPALAGAIATSGRNRRRWRTDRGIAHHLIDPRTGEPVEGDIETATVFAGDAVTADVAAKALYFETAREGAGDLTGAALGITINDRGLGLRWEGEHAHALKIIPVVVWTGETA